MQASFSHFSIIYSTRDPRGDQGLKSSKNSTRSPREITLILLSYLIVHKLHLIADGLDPVNPVIRLPIERKISSGTRIGAVNTWDLLKKAFIQRYCPPSKTAKRLEDIPNFKQEIDESLYQAWERFNDLLYKCPTHDINSHQKALLKIWLIDCFRDKSRIAKEPLARSSYDYKWVFDLEIDQLADEYKIRIGKKGHMLDKIWEYCENVNRDNTYQWHDHGLEEEERKEIGIEIEKYDPPEVQQSCLLHHLRVTYTSVYTDSEPGRVFWEADEELSDEGSPRVIVYGYDGLPMQPVAPPSPDYIPGLEEPQTPPARQDEDERELMFIQPHDPEYVPEPMYPEYIPLEDEHVLPAEEQPLPPIDSPTAESPGYVAVSDPEEYDDDETEDGPFDYPMDGGDDDDGDSSGDDTDDEDEDEEDEEEEHLALADFAVVIPTVELVSPPGGTKPVIPPPSTDNTTTGATITVQLQVAISLPPEAEVERLLAMTTPPPSPLTSLSPPFAEKRLDRMASTQALIDAVTAALPSPQLPPLPPPLYIPPPVNRWDDVLETEMPPRKRLCLSTLGSRYEVRESSTAIPTEGRGKDYGDTWVDPTEAVPEIAPMTLGKRVDLLMEDKIAHQETILIVEEEAYVAREAWAHSIGLSHAVHSELQTHHTAPETLRMMRDMRREIGDMQAELLALREQPRRARQPGSDARVPDHQDAPRDTDRTEGVFVANENEKIDKYINGLPDNIYECVKSSKPKTLDETIELANDFMDQKLRTYAERSSGNANFVNAQRDNRVYAAGNAEKKWNASRDPDSNVVMGNSYDVELADGKIVGVNTIMRGCTLNFLNHLFNIDLMPVELDSFDVIIGMDWLRRCHAMIVCDEKLVRVPYGNETLIFRSDESNDEKESRLTIISCSKAQEYMEKGCQIFLAQISAKKEEDKSKGKNLRTYQSSEISLKCFLRTCWVFL
nr:reverse transcriptase domain-containing protein [Tanacetum cinerariifolium]